MRSLLFSLLMLLLLSCTTPAGAAQACAVPAAPGHADADAWLLLAGLVVAAAGRLAAHPRR